ncbi:MAG TPA: cytochrome P450 [Steroidobacteraceae bacterium]|nr:cytochrome P450 [Steroidobacteraceae bacterium]
MSAQPKPGPGWHFDPGDPDLIRNPYPYYAYLREQPGLHKATSEYFVASRYAEVRDVITNHAAFGQGNFVRNIQLYYGPGFDPMTHSSYRWLSEVFVMQDPPAHTRLRKLVSFALTPKRVAAMQPRIQQIVDGLIDGMVRRGEAELLWDFAYQLPTLVMCDMLGLEGDERSPASLAKLTRAVAESFIVFETRALPADLLAQADAQMDYLNEFFGRIYDRKQAYPGDDLSSALVQAIDEDGSALSKAEVANVIVAMFGAGFETTAHLIGNGVWAMQREPGQWATLVANPDEVAPRAVEECLRFESSLQGTYRTALKPATVGSFEVKPGERVLCLLGSANRDPSVFERADVMDVTRKDSRMLSFGGGIHHCIGQQLARLEGRVAFATLAKRLPHLRVTTPEPTWRHGFLFRGLTELRCAT